MHSILAGLDLDTQVHWAGKTSIEHIKHVMLQADLLGQFRTEVLGLPSLYRKEDLHKVPFTYCFSPTLVPRPSDWPRELIDIVGFFFLDGSKSNYKPPQELVEFLADKDKPVYFGFGSLVVDKPQVHAYSSPVDRRLLDLTTRDSLDSLKF